MVQNDTTDVYMMIARLMHTVNDTWKAFKPFSEQMMECMQSLLEHNGQTVLNTKEVVSG